MPVTPDPMTATALPSVTSGWEGGGMVLEWGVTRGGGAQPVFSFCSADGTSKENLPALPPPHTHTAVLSPV
jgi:hypothetical protein